MAETDAYIKLFDSHGAHPRISSITFPGDANTLDMYNSIYGHGAVIENPWVAFRVYMDNRQSIDLYVKASPRLELEETGFYSTPDQIKQGYGCDVLWAGKSIGAGSFRGWQNNTPVTIDSVATRTQSVINACTIEVQNKSWQYNGHPIQMTQYYSVSPDSRELSVTISLKDYHSDDIFAVGIQKLESDNRGFITPDGIAAAWGSNVPDKNHPELVESVGLGIEVADVNIITTVEDELNYLILVRPNVEGTIKYRIWACGNRETNGFKDADQWFKFVKSNNKNIW